MWGGNNAESQNNVLEESSGHGEGDIIQIAQTFYVNKKIKKS
jgi:hypothetical protein